MSVRRKDVLIFLTNVIGKNLDISKTKKFIENLFDLNKKEVGVLEKQETYFIRKMLGVLDDGVMKDYKDISFAMNLSVSDVENLETVVLKKIKKDLDVSYKSILISSLGFSVNAFGSLRNKSINTLGELLDKSIEELNRICYMNQETVSEIVNKIHKMGYLFREEFDFNVKKDVYFNDEYIVSNLDDGREIYNFDYLDKSLFICNIDSKTKIRKYIFDKKLCQDFYLDELLKKIKKFIFLKEEGKKKLEVDFKEYIEKIQINKKNKIQNIVRKEFSGDIKYQEDNIDLVDSFYDYLKELYGENLIIVFCDCLGFDKNKVYNFGEYYNLVKFYERIIKFLELEKYEFNNGGNSLNKEKIKEIEDIKRNILEEKNNLLLNINKNYLKYADNDDFVNASCEFINKLFLDISLLLENNNDNISMSEIFSEIDSEYIERNFYHLFSPIEGNMEIPFIVKFNEVILKYCSKDDGTKYTEKEIIDFLMNKYVVCTMEEPNSINTLIEYLNDEVGRKLRQ